MTLSLAHPIPAFTTTGHSGAHNHVTILSPGNSETCLLCIGNALQTAPNPARFTKILRAAAAYLHNCPRHHTQPQPPVQLVLGVIKWTGVLGFEVPCGWVVAELGRLSGWEDILLEIGGQVGRRGQLRRVLAMAKLIGTLGQTPGIPWQESDVLSQLYAALPVLCAHGPHLLAGAAHVLVDKHAELPYRADCALANTLVHVLPTVPSPALLRLCARLAPDAQPLWLYTVHGALGEPHLHVAGVELLHAAAVGRGNALVKGWAGLADAAECGAALFAEAVQAGREVVPCGHVRRLRELYACVGAVDALCRLLSSSNLDDDDDDDDDNDDDVYGRVMGWCVVLQDGRVWDESDPDELRDVAMAVVHDLVRCTTPRGRVLLPPTRLAELVHGWVRASTRSSRRTVEQLELLANSVMIACAPPHCRQVALWTALHAVASRQVERSPLWPASLRSAMSSVRGVVLQAALLPMDERVLVQWLEPWCEESGRRDVLQDVQDHLFGEAAAWLRVDAVLDSAPICTALLRVLHPALPASRADELMRVAVDGSGRLGLLQRAGSSLTAGHATLLQLWLVLGGLTASYLRKPGAEFQPMRPEILAALPYCAAVAPGLATGGLLPLVMGGGSGSVSRSVLSAREVGQLWLDMRDLGERGFRMMALAMRTALEQHAVDQPPPDWLWFACDDKETFDAFVLPWVWEAAPSLRNRLIVPCIAAAAPELRRAHLLRLLEVPCEALHQALLPLLLPIAKGPDRVLMQALVAHGTSAQMLCAHVNRWWSKLHWDDATALEALLVVSERLLSVGGVLLHDIELVERLWSLVPHLLPSSLARTALQITLPTLCPTLALMESRLHSVRLQPLLVLPMIHRIQQLCRQNVDLAAFLVLPFLLPSRVLRKAQWEPVRDASVQVMEDCLYTDPSLLSDWAGYVADQCQKVEYALSEAQRRYVALVGLVRVKNPSF